MQDKSHRLFSNSKFFAAVTFLGALCFILYAALGMNGQIYGFTVPLSLGLTYVILAVCLLCLFFSYESHSKNVMKGLMGGLLMTVVILSLNGLEAELLLDKICGVLFLIFAVALTVNHFLINRTHSASPAQVFLNQFIALLMFLNHLSWSIGLICLSPILPNIVSSLVSAVAMLCMLASVVCIETKLDAYRLDREAAGWTEEEGYPQDYDRTKNYGK